ncbi:helix-turn-helix transcriptional regulator [Aphanothece sacrum]|uniref:XRE family transcriptional regulator n=1 Tax=Aphanothece sacrum FPU1 TaxID=1920663 RepID=A0A401IGW7_APHSA|nr:helix-turn-helix transcriptional regulator [Aphanothece sacrum]GBF80508.1 XRE family transcriptional regulator [Aphanothece sacrum FPU1]GBF85899.1 XRE family transcriptional regulator [Aphanothece sacrum FPU3]
MNKNKKSFIKTIREEKNLTRKELANIFGVTEMTIYNWENNNNIFEEWIEKIIKGCELLEYNLNDLKEFLKDTTNIEINTDKDILTGSQNNKIIAGEVDNKGFDSIINKNHDSILLPNHISDIFYNGYKNDQIFSLISEIEHNLSSSNNQQQSNDINQTIINNNCLGIDTESINSNDINNQGITEV